ncbi:hypothetical protein EsH8_I_001125 [Colletotrichum jinshuiense]
MEPFWDGVPSPDSSSRDSVAQNANTARQPSAAGTSTASLPDKLSKIPRTLPTSPAQLDSLRVLTVPPSLTEADRAIPRSRRPADILIFPASPMAEDIIIVRMEREETSLLPKPKPRQSLALRRKSSPATAAKRPKILLSTKNFTWVKTNNDIWVKVPPVSRKHRIVIKRKEKRDQH